MDVGLSKSTDQQRQIQKEREYCDERSRHECLAGERVRVRQEIERAIVNVRGSFPQVAVREDDITNPTNHEGATRKRCDAHSSCR